LVAKFQVACRTAAITTSKSENADTWSSLSDPAARARARRGQFNLGGRSQVMS
jgi:hypothetical protein